MNIKKIALIAAILSGNAIVTANKLNIADRVKEQLSQAIARTKEAELRNQTDPDDSTIADAMRNSYVATGLCKVCLCLAKNKLSHSLTTKDLDECYVKTQQYLNKEFTFYKGTILYPESIKSTLEKGKQELCEIVTEIKAQETSQQ